MFFKNFEVLHLNRGYKVMFSVIPACVIFETVGYFKMRHDNVYKVKAFGSLILDGYNVPELTTVNVVSFSSA